LYSGQDAIRPFATVLFVFDYDGNPIKALKLDVNFAFNMAIDEGKNMAYVAFTEGDNGGVARFSLDLP
jgi:hypothetical protein